jgi:hypothetical protein
MNGGRKVSTGVWWVKLRERDHMEDTTWIGRYSECGMGGHGMG